VAPGTFVAFGVFFVLGFTLHGALHAGLSAPASRAFRLTRGRRLTGLFTQCIVSLMSTGHMLLGLLAEGERHGYELKREHDARFPAARPLAFGQVYATLERLRKSGLVSAATSVKVDGPQRTPFTMTPAGRDEFERWLTEVQPPSPYVANPLSVKVTLALLTAGEPLAQDFLRRQRDAHLSRMREYTRLKSRPDSSLAEVLAADYALTHLDADLRWIDAALERVAELNKELHSCPVR